MTDIDTIAKIMSTTAKNAKTRIIRLKIGPTCTRCCGSGQYSYNQINGSTCFGCNGFTVTMPKSKAEWEATRIAAERVVADGTMAAYIARNLAYARAKNGSKRFFAAWGKMDGLNWYNRGLGGEDRWDIPDNVRARNAVAYELSKRLDKIHNYGRNTDWVEYDRVLTEGLAAIAKITAELADEWGCR